MKVAIVHDWLNGLRGGERCLLSFLEIYPQADIFTLFHEPGTTDSRIDNRVKHTSFLNRLRIFRRNYRYLLPFYPLAISQFNFSEYDLVISLSHAAAKNIHVPQNVVHICYCFTPMRYIWDQTESYFGRYKFILQPLIHALRSWDRRGSMRLDGIIAISRFVAARIRCFYKITADVIFPPVDSSWIVESHCEDKNLNKSTAPFLVAGALVPYKRVDLAIRAFNEIGEKLIIVGDGPEMSRLKKIAGPNIEFFGHVSDQELSTHYHSCRALIFPGVEDFGMVPVEVMAAGTPIIALERGGTRETVAGVRNESDESFVDKSGVFIRYSKNQNRLIANIVLAVEYFKANESRLSSESCRKRAQLFSRRQFVEDWNAYLAKMGWHRFIATPGMDIEPSDRMVGAC